MGSKSNRENNYDIVLKIISRLGAPILFSPLILHITTNSTLAEHKGYKDFTTG